MSIRIKEMDRHDLLEQVLLHEHNIKNYELVYNKNGKPSIKNQPVCINLSTSKGISAVVTAHVDVGICIRHFFYDDTICDKCFNQKEKEKVRESQNYEYDFTRIYTLKIAYLKMLGLKKEYPLIDIDTVELDGWRYTANKDYIVSILYRKKEK